jgi:phosphoribosylformimino-5-aminoimidazole carboxamide ribotide isomerase
MPQDGKSDETQ